MLVRQAKFAGSLYPANPDQLSAQLASMLLATDEQTGVAKALIVPQSGYFYSGQVAAAAYRCLQKNASAIKHVVLLGSHHGTVFNGLALTDSHYFTTPLGEVLLEQSPLLAQLSHVVINNTLHNQAFSLEIQLPFLQICLLDFSLLPILVGQNSLDALVSLIDSCLGRDDTLVVVSSDLCQFCPLAVVDKMDGKTHQQITQLLPEINDQQANCFDAINALIVCAKKNNYQAKLLAQCTSADTMGLQESVVGYGSFVFYQ